MSWDVSTSCRYLPSLDFKATRRAFREASLTRISCWSSISCCCSVSSACLRSWAIAIAAAAACKIEISQVSQLLTSRQLSKPMKPKNSSLTIKGKTRTEKIPCLSKISRSNSGHSVTISQIISPCDNKAAQRGKTSS